MEAVQVFIDFFGFYSVEFTFQCSLQLPGSHGAFPFRVGISQGYHKFLNSNTLFSQLYNSYLTETLRMLLPVFKTAELIKVFAVRYTDVRGYFTTNFVIVGLGIYAKQMLYCYQLMADERAVCLVGMFE